MKKYLLLLLPFLFIPMLLSAQGVTTATLSGTIVDQNGEALIGANIVAVHEPSGTRYGAATDVNGNFRIPNMRVGGPYRVRASFAGFQSSEIENLHLRLGETERRTFTLSEAATELETVTVTAIAGSVGQTSGSSTQISTRDIENLPSLDRNINDYLRSTPQSNLVGDGISFAGINNRYNSIYIDGAVNNDVFGLAASGTNGGQTGISPFSTDIIEQFQVVLSPYDVSLGGFAGGGINAVTKSGTNTYQGTAYTFVQNERLVGRTNGTLADRIGVERERVDEFANRIYGFSVGGPIIEDRLFFFTNVELQRDATPRPFEVQSYTTTAGRASTSDLESLRNHLINQYSYDPGTFGSTSQDMDGTKFFGKLDFNINENNYLTLRHQYTSAEQFSRSVGNASTINFSNSGIYFPSVTNSSALELNSIIGDSYSNNLTISYVRVRDDRDPLEARFPYVIINDEGGGQIRLGSEQFSTANQLDQDIFTITNNFEIYRGNHTITLGTHNEFYSIYNLFIPQNFGTYEFDSLSDFINGEPASSYTRAYSLVDNITGSGSAAAADFNAMQLGLYAQNEWRATDQLSLTFGLRIDVPFITDDPDIHETFNSQSLPSMQARYSVAENTTGGKSPDPQIMWSPRIGFNYNFADGSQTTLRGGAGLFTSRIPFVWPGAMFNNNGLIQGQVTQNDIPGDVNFIADVDNQYTNPNFTVPSGQVYLFSDDFKYPQIFRTNLALDFELPFGIQTTVEGLFTKTVNNIVYYNINSDPTVAFNWTGNADNRPVYVGQNIDPTYSAVYLGANTSRGYSYNTSVTLSKLFDFGLNATVAYSWGDSYALSEGTSSQNSSQWRGQVNVEGRNNPSYGRSDFAAGHRALAALSYTHYWSVDANNATTISLFANMQSGIPYSYVLGGGAGNNPTNERGSTSRQRSLAYIPATASDINLVDYTVNGQTVTAAEQWEALDRFIRSDDYLSSNRGAYAEKNASFGPFTAIFDLGIRQDFGLNIGGQRHRMQLSVDIQNVGNMINNDWGVIYNIPGSDNNYFLYTFEGLAADGTTPEFTYRGEETGRESFDIDGGDSRWRMRFGVRYLFN